MGLVDRKPRTVLGVAFVASAALLGAAVTAFVTVGGDGSTAAVSPVVTPGPTAVATPAVTVEPTPVISIVPSPTSTPSASASASPSPAGSASATPSATATATATATGTPARTYPYPAPSQQYAGLVLSATLNPGSGTTATTFDLRLKATDGDGEIYFDGLVWGDGASVPAQASPQKCGTFPPRTSPAGRYQPSPGSEGFGYQHRYTSTGTYTLTAKVSSINKDCKPNGPKAETRTVVFKVKVSPAPTSAPTPRATASPTPAATTAPTAAPTAAP